MLPMGMTPLVAEVARVAGEQGGAQGHQSPIRTHEVVEGGRRGREK